MKTELYWIRTPTSGRLAIMPRPRGGEWLEDEVRAWRSAGVDIVVSLLTTDEITDLDLVTEQTLCEAHQIQFISFPIIDRGVPASTHAALELFTTLSNQLAEGKSIAIHCRQGIGRAALVAICVLIQSGVAMESAIQQVGSARGCSVPETLEQRRWISAFVASLRSSSSDPLPMN